MNIRRNWNTGWEFSKKRTEDAVWGRVDLPHTWNGVDGQDGGDDYYRGTCYYRKILLRREVPDGKDIYLEFQGVNSTAVLLVNGTKAARHDGGYSTWRADITEYLDADKEENEILIAVDNAPNDHVYPQRADFTFYGGIYRDVVIIFAEKTRFDLDHWGSPGVKITPRMTGQDAEVTAEVFLTGTEGDEILEYQILDGSIIAAETVQPVAVQLAEELHFVGNSPGEQYSVTESSGTAHPLAQKAVLMIRDAHLWDGRKDPYLYRLRVRLIKGGKELDRREISFGCRSFSIDQEKGFILNGKPYPLHGVSRHQDRPEIGNALKREHHEEDMDLICELGANSIRLAHYQHDQYFYDLCDRKGLIVWAEIPYISRHLENGYSNTIRQMTELICQNYNYPCIAVWGLSNEITMGARADEALLKNHRDLNDLAHRLDPTRLTTEAVVTMCSMDDPYVHIPDTVAYNHYYGWYGGDIHSYGEFMDEFHRKYPDQPIGLSEYGCEALNWHSSDPIQGDYTEEYQAYYHEELIRQLFPRKYIWCTYVWNMFDFGADARSEGGEDGINHKGLVTFDRKYKKDAFYAYKAWLSDEPFVHICGKRYVDRVEDMTKVTVYSNQPEVELYANGVSLGKQQSMEHFFYFLVPNTGVTKLTAKAGSCTDESEIRKVDEFNEVYRMKEKGDVLNWFEITAPEGYFSINDRRGEIMKDKRGARVIKSVLAKAYVKKKLCSRKKEEKSRGTESKGHKIDLNNQEMKQFLYGMSVKRLLSMAGTMGPQLEFKKEDVLRINIQLNRIRKPENESKGGARDEEK